MNKRAYTPEQIINKLREVEVLLSQGLTVAEASKKIGETQHRLIIAIDILDYRLEVARKSGARKREAGVCRLI